MYTGLWLSNISTNFYIRNGLLFYHMSDDFDKLNRISSLHGPRTTIFCPSDKGSSDAVENHSENDTLEIFVNMIEYLEEYYYLFEEVEHHVLTYHTNHESNFKNQFPELTLQEHEWV
jgi:hypothetical protein